jgi:hypothetical protein
MAGADSGRRAIPVAVTAVLARTRQDFAQLAKFLKPARPELPIPEVAGAGWAIVRTSSAQPGGASGGISPPGKYFAGNLPRQG